MDMIAVSQIFMMSPQTSNSGCNIQANYWFSYDIPSTYSGRKESEMCWVAFKPTVVMKGD